MSIVHDSTITEEVLNEETTLVFKSRWEAETSWIEVSIKYKGQEKELGSYYIDGIAGITEWIEYNENCVIFFGNNRYEDLVYISQVYNIKEAKFITGSQEKLANFYEKSFQGQTKTKNLTCLNNKV